MPNTLLSILALSVGLLQAWDSNALLAERPIQVLILVAVLIPPAAIAATRDMRIRGASIVLTATLLIAARFLSSVDMPELALAALFPGILVLMDHFRTMKSGSTGDTGARV